MHLFNFNIFMYSNLEGKNVIGAKFSNCARDLRKDSVAMSLLNVLEY